MKKLNEIFILEDFNELNIRQMGWGWDKNSWWIDKPIFYHGTHTDNLDAIAEDGIKAGPGSKGTGVYLALDPFTARGYASMAAAGGERAYKQKTNAESTPMEQRAVLTVEVPKDQLDKLVISKTDSRLLDKKSWEDKGKGNPKYWELAEVLYPFDIPASYIKGYMVKS